MDPFKYREIRGYFTARTPDTADSDLNPDQVPLNGYATLNPQFQGGSIVFTEIGEFAIPQQLQARIVDGHLMVEATEGEENILQPLHLPVTVDDRANQKWSWRIHFDSLTIGEYGDEVSHPDLSFPVEDGADPLNLSTVATTLKQSGPFITRGARGPGIESITASNGVVTVEWDGGDDVEIPIPTAALATRFNDGLMARTDVERLEPIEEGDTRQWRVTDRDGQVAIAVTERGTVEIAGTETRASDVPYRVVDSQDRIAFEIDAQGRTHIYDLAGSGAGVTSLHVFVAAGQSNMSGRGTPLVAELDTTDPRIMQYGSTRRRLEKATIPLDMHDTPIGLSPATVFAREYLRNQPSDVGVLIVPTAHGGTGFTWTETATGLTWTKGTATDPANALYELSVAQTQQALTAATDAGYAVSLRGVLWHQGEANGGAATAMYSTYLDRLIGDYRTDLGASSLPSLSDR